MVISSSYFNSIKVRLKLGAGAGVGNLLLFQFHKGTIKTILCHLDFVNIPLFQFHKGTIKTYSAGVPSASESISIP